MLCRSACSSLEPHSATGFFSLTYCLRNPCIFHKSAVDLWEAELKNIENYCPSFQFHYLSTKACPKFTTWSLASKHLNLPWWSHDAKDRTKASTISSQPRWLFHRHRWDFSSAPASSPSRHTVENMMSVKSVVPETPWIMVRYNTIW